MNERAGKIMLITGASSGIGLATAVELARRGAELVLPVRDPARGEAALAAIRRAVPAARLHLLALDLASFASIRACAADVLQRWPRLDVLLLNAGISPAQRRVTVDGFESTFAVNHLGHFLLTLLLLPALRAAASARVVVVASSVHKGQRLDFDDLQAERGFSMMQVYARSKLANMLFARALARRLQGSGITVNALHPGVVDTGLAREFPWPFRVLAKLAFIAPAKGARTSVYLATAPEVEGSSGGYYAKCRRIEPDPAALDDDAAERLWRMSEAATGSRLG